VPEKEQTEEQKEILDLDSHLEKLVEGDRISLEISCNSSQEEKGDHNDYVKELECC
jgi:hypothetical protein